MKFVEKTNLNSVEKRQCLKLWNEEYPQELHYKNIEEFEDYLSSLQDQYHILLVDKNNNIRGWYFDFIRNKERWFAVIINSEIQGKGFGFQLVKRAMQYRLELNGWVIDSDEYKRSNGEAYRSPVGFYKKNGFSIDYSTRLPTNKIKAVKIKWKSTTVNS